MGQPVPNIRYRAFDSNGDPLAGGKLYSFIAGTTTPLATYSDPACTVPNTNPVILDGDGYADVFLGSSTYKFQLTDADDVSLWTRDNIPGDGSVSVPSGISSHSITAGQSATDLSGETGDGATYTSVVHEFEVLRGTTILANGKFILQFKNSAWVLVQGGYDSENDADHGVTWSFTETDDVFQLRVAVASDGNGDGTIKLKKTYFTA